ncbi:hypothetical protein OGAPHI_005086 [Ogataea philodendri]|uniref:ER membrane protein complex subunit 1 n=1 Tax=Ogataea philodendri TaxID=1378263 RepID=A0A9P8P211_9ASCO|nr:uncharacterized protein OGAPHI_005086 [Ogataea philodendri]KAH3663685.1 hypothetical protein OGAPHI_005086 [Ogataea philodendri]
MFRIDWQTVQIGRPFAALLDNGRVFSLTDENIFSVLDATTGSVLYRFQSPDPISHDSLLLAAWDELVASGLNSETGPSRLVFWTKEGLVDHELEVGPIAGIHSVRDESLLVVQKDGSVLQVAKDYTVETIEKLGPVSASKLASFANDLVLVAKTASKTAYKVLGGEEGILGCKFESILVTGDEIVCNKDAYSPENGKLAKHKNSALSSIAAGEELARVVNFQYLATLGDQVSVYDLDELKGPSKSYPWTAGTTDLVEFGTIDDKLAIFAVTGPYIQFYLDGELLWARDESLARIQDVVVADRHEKLSVSTFDLIHENQWSGYIDRLKRNFYLLSNHKPIDTQMHFGFNKSIIVLTENGNLYGYDSYGKQEWAIKDRGFSKIAVEGDFVYAFNDKTYVVADGTLHPADFKLEQPAEYPPNIDESFRLITTEKRSYDNVQVASPAVVLGTRRVLYKYLHPNTALAAFYNDETESLKLVVYNEATNQTYASFIHSTNNPDSLNLDFEENFIIFTTTEKNAPTSVIGVIELYESLTPDERSKSPEAQLRTYIFPARISALTVTRTKYNITSKWLILALETGEVVAVPRTVASARRPYGSLDADQKEEFQLFKYQPVVPLNPKTTLSHFRKLVGINKLVSVPTELESTSLVIASGTDLFVTFVRPSSSFDSMRSDFSKQTLLATMVVLLLSILVVRPMVDRKRVADVWVTRT